MNITKMAQAHNNLCKFSYDLGKVWRGYTDRVLHVDLTNNKVNEKQVEPEIKEKFVGGRGYGMWYLYQSTNENSKWNSPENEIVIAAGPIAGITQYPGAGKSYVCTISPLTHAPIDSNVGGYFGPYLKFAGFDALELQGKAKEDVVIYIDGNKGTVSIDEAPQEPLDSHILAEVLTEMYALNEEDKKHISVVSAGTAADYSNWGMLNFSFYDPRRKMVRLKQAGRGGIGRVFRDKKVKALIVKYEGLKGDSNNPADLGLIQDAGVKVHKEVHDYDDVQNQMRKRGTSYLVSIMDHFDILPVKNFKYGSHPDTPNIDDKVYKKKFTLSDCDGCWFGCTLACAKVVEGFELTTGPYKGQKVLVDGPEYETIAGVGSNCGIFDADYIIENNFYCDTYGIDTISFGTGVAYIMELYEAGILTDELTGGLNISFGRTDSALELLHQIARNESFGAIVGQGIRYVKNWLLTEVGGFTAQQQQFIKDVCMECKGLEYSEYVPKESLAQQGGYSLTNKGPQHDEAWLIFDDMIHNLMPTFEDKAEALYYFPLFRTWFSLVGLCKLPWNDIKPADNAETEKPSMIIGHVQNYIDLFNGVTGRNIDLDELVKQSARVYNLQRIFNLRCGFGVREHDQPPYRALGPVTVEEYESRVERYDTQLKDKYGVDPTGKSTEEKIALTRKLRDEGYQALCDAVFKRRGWTMQGIPKIETLEELGIAYANLVSLIKPHQ
ncbi:aldehyde ferredoxin oxidoreductase C-terminal domain-containing protein [Clostridium sp. 'deep sea']|uniref:aldehyde ferredoxin oxidoreductase family protein n=1 Tax=Clostridium sp. 'deep sea' TaxID=2779445 RepID=UPI001A9B330B|nr:aldehyde ferredoxin oxidoreductase C-terminal domain-containing protein [Clostridium sp. 'deep sea']